MRTAPLLLLLACARAADDPAIVRSTVETDPVPHDGDAADDPAIWVHPDDPSRSTVIGTDKRGGLGVYSLDGRQIQYLADGDLNNVDVRYNFPLGGRKVALVTAGNQTGDTIACYRVDPATGKLHDVAARPIRTGLRVYGSCMYRSARTGKTYAIVNSYSGEIQQWELFDDGRGRVDARKVRELRVASTPEGCVADDELGHLYVGEERAGIWKFGAEPDADPARTRVDSTGTGGHLTADVEGLAIYHAPRGTGYLLASSQGNDSFVVYRREGKNEYLMTFKIGASVAVDGVTDCDGIDVTNVSLGPAFPKGLFVAQDGTNDRGNQNFKLVPWEAIAGAGRPGLAVDTRWDPAAAGR